MLNISVHKSAFSRLVFTGCLSILLISCSDSTDSPSSNNESQPVVPLQADQQTPSINTQSVPETTALLKIIDEHFSQLENASKQLNKNLISFTQKPSEEGLNTAIEALNKTHALFTAGYFLDACCGAYSPNITNQKNKALPLTLKTKLDQQPLLPGYLDSVEGYPYSGLIYSDIPITRQSMEREFQLGDPTYVTLGFHALGVILKGSHLNRKVRDFARLSITQDTSSAPAELRRTLYAILLSSEIENDISILKLFWESDLRNNLVQVSQTPTNKFIEALHAKAGKELNTVLALQPEPERQADIDAHNTQEIIDFKKALLESLVAIKELPTKS